MWLPQGTLIPYNNVILYQTRTRLYAYSQNFKQKLCIKRSIFWELYKYKW